MSAKKVRNRQALLRLGRLILIMGLVASATGPTLFGQEPPLSGTSFQQALAQRAGGFTWNARPLRDGLNGISSRTKIAIFLDRRVDPDQEVAFSTPDVALEDLLEKLTSQLGLAYCIVDAVVYIGRPADVDRLATHSMALREPLRRMSRQQRASYLKKEELAWEDYAEPKLLIESLARQDDKLREYGVLGDLPYDLWAANRLPALPWIDAMNILLAGFDLAIGFTEGSAQAAIVPLPAPTPYAKTYRPKFRFSDEQFGKILNRIPIPDETKSDAEFSFSNGQLRVTGTYLTHQYIARTVRGRPQVQNEGEKVYTLEDTVAPAGSVIQTVARQRGLTLDVSPEANESLGKPVTLNVVDVTIDELLKLTLDQVGLVFEIRGNKLLIRKN